MKTPTPFAKELATFPTALRQLVEAELKAGNEIAAIERGFPAAPCGASVKLARAVAEARRKSAGEVRFYDRNNRDYAGEFTTAERHFFVLEPPHPPEPEPDMDAIRAAHDAKEQAANADRFREDTLAAVRAQLVAQERAAGTNRFRDDAPATPSPIAPKPATAVDRFRASMVMNFERWHDGIGYDLEILKTVTPEELVEIEELLLPRAMDDWRDVEALAALDSPRARVALRKALKSSNHQVRTAVLQHAPALVSEAERTATLVAALEESDTYGGLTQALLQVQSFHPPQIIDALLRGVLARTDGAPVHFAAMLMFLHGQAKTAFDWDQRPFFLEFNPTGAAKRRALFRELCAKIGVAPEPYL